MGRPQQPWEGREQERGNWAAEYQAPDLGWWAPKLGDAILPVGSSAGSGPSWAGRGEAGGEPRGVMQDTESFLFPADHLPGAWEGERGRKVDTGGRWDMKKRLMSPSSIEKS